MTQFYTYIYLDPKDNTPIYVGKGKENRVHTHFKGKGKLGNVLRKRKAEGYTPQPIIINMPSEAEALQLEIFWIMYYGRADLSLGTLFNLTNGGDGATGNIPWNKGKTGCQTAWNKGLPPEQQPRFGTTHTSAEETKEKIRQARTKQITNPESVQRAAEKNRQKFSDPVWKHQHSERMKQMWAQLKARRDYAKQ